jgi:hypothetical protein
MMLTHITEGRSQAYYGHVLPNMTKKQYPAISLGWENAQILVESKMVPQSIKQCSIASMISMANHIDKTEPSA